MHLKLSLRVALNHIQRCGLSHLGQIHIRQIQLQLKTFRPLDCDNIVLHAGGGSRGKAVPCLEIRHRILVGERIQTYFQGLNIVYLLRHVHGVGLHLDVRVVCISPLGKLTVQQPLPVKFRGLCNSGNLFLQLPDFILDNAPVRIRLQAVGGLDCKLIHSLKHLADLCHGSVRRLNDGHAVTGIAVCLGKPFQLGVHPVCHGQTCGIVLGSVYLQAGGKPLQGFCKQIVIICQ